MDNSQISEAVKILKQGGIVIYPTDTAFGIGCRIDNPDSVRRLFEMRRRPETRAVPVLVDSAQMAGNYLLSPLPNNVRRLMEDFWPGGLTVIYYCQPGRITPLVRGGGSTLGVRMPDHGTALELIKGLGTPLLGPSANFHGEATPHSLQGLNPELVSLADFVVEGECKNTVASTVVDATSVPFTILRPGAVTVDPEKYK